MWSVEDNGEGSNGIVRDRITVVATSDVAGTAQAYCDWLCTSAAVKLGLSHRAVKNISTAFRSDPGKRVLELYLRS